MPDMSIKGSSSSYGSTYFQSLTKNSKINGTSNNQKDSSTLGLTGEGSLSVEQKKENTTGVKTEGNSGGNTELSEADQITIQQLKTIENGVIAHEQAHKSVGGSLAGGASYSYTTGPDGKRYISGGEVSISTPATDDKEKRVQLLEQVKQAALAPAQPSPQDVRVAAGANSEQLQLNAAIQREKGLKAYEDSKADPVSQKDKKDSKTEIGPLKEGKKNNKILGQYFNQVG